MRIQEIKNRTAQREKKQRPEGRTLASVLVLALVLGLCLTGCSLAIEEPQGETGTLCGAIVTAGEQEAERQQEEKLEGQVIELRPSLSGNSLEDAIFDVGRILPEGKANAEGRVIFGGVDGEEFLYREELCEEEGGSYTASSTTGSPAFSNVHISMNRTDEGEETEVTADCYVASGTGEIVYISPVYIREDGSYYTELNSSAGYLMEETSPGGAFGKTFTESTQRNGDGQSTHRSFGIGINLVSADEVTKICIREMDAQDTCIREREYTYQEELRYPLLEETAYVLVEETVKKADGTAGLHRLVYDRPAEGEEVSHSSYFKHNGPLLLPMTVTFEP